MNTKTFKFVRNSLATLFLMGFASVSMAVSIPEGQNVQTKTAAGDTLVITALQSFESNAGEDEVAFLKRVGVYMQDYSAKNKVETCASIWTNSKTKATALEVFTTNAHTGCLIVTENPKDGDWVKSDDTIHSHPLVRQININAADSALTGKAVGTKEELFNAVFSPEDKEAGAGFLIANRHLQYQNDGGKYYKDYGSLN